MGTNENAKVQVNLNRPTEFYQSGEQVLGTILFSNDHDGLKLKEIFVELVGKLAYATEESLSSVDCDGNSTTNPYTEYHHVTIFYSRMSVARPGNDQHNEMIINSGIYTWSFHFDLPENLPPSSSPHVEAHPHIKYYIRIVLHKPWYKRDTIETHSLTVCPRINIYHMNGFQRTLCFTNQNRKKLCLQGYLFCNGVIPGQFISFQVNINNPERTKIKRVHVALVQHREAMGNHYSDVISSLDLSGLNEFDGLYFQQNFGIPIPSNFLTPTHNYSTVYSGFTYNFRVHYVLLFEVESHGIFTNFDVRVPVLVGTDAIIDEQQQQQQNDDFPKFIKITPGTNQTDLPPSFETVTKDKQYLAQSN